MPEAARTAVAAGIAATGLTLAWWWHARERPALGYSKGVPVPIRVVLIDGKPVEVETARAYRAMRAAAARAGARLVVVSGFRTMAEQEYLYQCFKTGDCNNGNLAAKPGHSNHQSGRALDLNARDPMVGPWLRGHAGEFKFRNTVVSEPWHWEYRP